VGRGGGWRGEDKWKLRNGRREEEGRRGRGGGRGLGDTLQRRSGEKQGRSGRTDERKRGKEQETSSRRRRKRFPLVPDVQAMFAPARGLAGRFRVASRGEAVLKRQDEGVQRRGRSKRATENRQRSTKTAPNMKQLRTVPPVPRIVVLGQSYTPPCRQRQARS
jgi:hypothetical protein